MMRLTGILLTIAMGTAATAELRVEKTDPLGRKVENEFFVADLSHRTVKGRTEDSGTLQALTLKAFDVTLFRDPRNGRMHKGVSIQRVGAPSYKDIGTWTPAPALHEEQTRSMYTHRREGYFDDYPEVKIMTEYRFPADAPYFVVSESMTVEKPLRVTMVRSNEMTMDLFFTHVAWPGRDGKVRVAAFDERKPILEKDPIPVDAPWVAFVNLDKGYGYGFVTLEHQASKTANADITISDGFQSGTKVINGHYWSRHVITGKETDLAPGDQFKDVTAYVLFRCSKDKPVAELLDWEKKIRRAR